MSERVELTRGASFSSLSLMQLAGCRDGADGRAPGSSSDAWATAYFGLTLITGFWLGNVQSVLG